MDDATLVDYAKSLDCIHCGLCLDACPTDAIVAPFQLDARRCISYLTIELREAIPTSFEGKLDNWMFGCDVCQEVCPWNRFSKSHEEPDFEPHPDLLTMKKQDWEEITEEIFRSVFRKSAVKRTKFSGLKRNIEFLKSKESRSDLDRNATPKPD